MLKKERKIKSQKTTNQPTKSPQKNTKPQKKLNRKPPKGFSSSEVSLCKSLRRSSTQYQHKLNIWGCQTLCGFYKLLVSLLDLNFPRFLQALMQNSHCILQKERRKMGQEDETSWTSLSFQESIIPLTHFSAVLSLGFLVNVCALSSLRKSHC